MSRSVRSRFAPAWLALATAVAVALVPAGASMAQSAASPEAAARNLDDHLAAIAQRVPGFGGFFFDEAGRPTVYLRDAREAPAGRAAAAGLLAGRRAGRGPTARAAGPDDVQVRPGAYDFAQLLSWKHALRGALGIPGVVFLDADERQNRVHVGIERGADAAAVRKLAARLGIPEAAVTVSEVEPFRPMATLRDYVRPTAGGLQIAFSGYLCTLGFNNYRGGTLGFATNSHCTNVQGGVENTSYYQPSTSSSTYHIGYEYADPAYWTGSPCPPGRRCRYSDSALAYYRSGVSVDVGRIARTTSYGSSSGSITIDAANPRFVVIGEAAYPTAGQVLDKIGRTTGWTYGQVTNTCVDTNVANSNITLLCQDHVAAGVGPGDSGSPVFYWHGGSDVTLYGLLWGGGSGTFAFSAMSNIEYELGDLVTR